MKLKSLLLLPFIITGCTGNNISSEEIPLTTLPTLPSTLPSSNTDRPTSTSDNSSTIEEDPLSDLPTAESLNNLRRVKPVVNNETMRDITWLDFGFGRNVHIDADMTNPEILDEEHCPFVPEVYEAMNEHADSGFKGANYSTLKSSTFDGLCKEFGRYFYEESFSQYYEKDIKEIAESIREAKIAKYLGQFYKKTNFDKGIYENKTYAMLTTVSSANYTSRNSIYTFDNYGFKDSYLQELKEVLEKNEFQGYYDLFEKYGTEYIYKVTYGPRQAMYLGFSGNVTFEVYGYNQQALTTEITNLVERNGDITINDFSVTECEYEWGEEDWKGARQVSYGTRPFYNLLPEKYDLYKYEDRMHDAYKKYSEMKLQELEKSVEDLVEEQNYINDAYYKQFDEEISKKNPFTYNFNFVEETTMYNPCDMFEAGFTKLYMRPRITLSSEEKYDAEITIGGKRAKVDDKVWYQIDINDIKENGTNISFKLTPGGKIKAEVIIEFCYMK